MTPRISLIIPAHNESAFLPACLEAARQAADRTGSTVETVVVLNRCTDDTEAIARRHGCVIVREDAKNLSAIRNAGVAAAAGEIIVTCDADSRMHPDSFMEVLKRLDSGKVVGGGAVVLPERWSPGIVASAFAILPYLAFRTGCRRLPGSRRRGLRKRPAAGRSVAAERRRIVAGVRNRRRRCRRRRHRACRKGIGSSRR